MPSADSCIRGTLTDTIAFPGPEGSEINVDLSGDRLVGVEFINHASRVLDPTLLSQLAQTGGLPSLEWSEAHQDFREVAT